MRSLIDRVFQQETINFVVTNHIPRRLATRLIGWFSRIEQPLVRDLSIATWTMFAGDLRLDEAKKTRFASMHDCFVRELKDDARPIDHDPGTLVSPCDGIVGAHGPIRGNQVLQAKGRSYPLDELLGGDAGAVERLQGGTYVTLRLTAAMYHRFHAPSDCQVHDTVYVPGDVWNVNPATLKRVAGLYCRNERAVVHARLAGHQEIVLVAVGAILVASIQLHFVGTPLTLACRRPGRMACDARFRKGDELGYFHHGSTIIVIAPAGFVPVEHIREGHRIRMGEPLLRVSEYRGHA